MHQAEDDFTNVYLSSPRINTKHSTTEDFMKGEIPFTGSY